MQNARSTRLLVPGDKMKIQIKDGKEITLKLDDLLIDVHEQLDEFEQMELIRKLGWTDACIKEAIKIISDEYSSLHWCSYLSLTRKQILDNIKQRQIEFYADKICHLIQDKFNEANGYWNIYHHHQDFIRDLEEKYPELNPIICKIKKPEKPNWDKDLHYELKKIAMEVMQDLKIKGEENNG